MKQNYSLDALAWLLDEACLPERYWPLIPYRELLRSGLAQLGCRTKADTQALSEEELFQLGLPDADMVRLLRRFLALYDANPQKFREIEKLSLTPEEKSAFRELYCLPGVKAVRAELYYRSGFRSLKDFVQADVGEVLDRTARTIREQQLTCIVPLPKEVRTHIAAARAFCTLEGDSPAGV